MILGGIPYYLNLFQKDLSVAQNIDRLFYGKEPKLDKEYDYLFSAIFKNSQIHRKVIELLSKNRLGYSKKEIAEKLKLTDNGEFYNVLTALEKSDFIMEYHPFGDDGVRGNLLRLMDNFCLFWLHFYQKHNAGQESFWLHNQNSSEIKTWQGYAFEDVCFNHISQIKNALGISGVNVKISSLTVKGNKKKTGAQIDMVIIRDDKVVNICEMKYTKTSFVVDKKYNETLHNKLDSIMNVVGKSSVHLTLVSPLEIKSNEYSDIFTSHIVLDDLFI